MGKTPSRGVGGGGPFYGDALRCLAGKGKLKGEGTWGGWWWSKARSIHRAREGCVTFGSDQRKGDKPDKLSGGSRVTVGVQQIFGVLFGGNCPFLAGAKIETVGRVRHKLEPGHKTSRLFLQNYVESRQSKARVKGGSTSYFLTSEMM